MQLIATTIGGDVIPWDLTAEFIPDCSGIVIDTYGFSNRDSVPGKDRDDTLDISLENRFDTDYDWLYCVADDYLNMQFFVENDGPFPVLATCPNAFEEVTPVTVCIENHDPDKLAIYLWANCNE